MKTLLVTILLVATAVAAPAQSGLFENESTIAPELDRMYVKGVRYLAKVQQSDGSWPNQYGTEPAVVGLCLLSILAHGEDPNYGPYRLTIRRGVDFLLKQQDTNTGYIGTTMYNHGFATLALAECYGTVQDSRLGPALQKAVNLILSSQKQNPYNAWRYSPDARDADTTVSGAQVVALLAARNAGVGVPEEAITKALKYFAQCQGPDGSIGYTSPGGGNAAKTAIAALVLALAKQESSNTFKRAADYLKETSAENEHYYHYYLYYASQAMFRIGPAAFGPWNSANVKTLAESQTSDGSWGGEMGPTFSTATSLLSLALNYRLLPIYER